MSYLQNQWQNRYVSVSSFRQAIQGPNQVKPQRIEPSCRNQPTRERAVNPLYSSTTEFQPKSLLVNFVCIFLHLVLLLKPTFISDNIMYTGLFSPGVIFPFYTCKQFRHILNLPCRLACVLKK